MSSWNITEIGGQDGYRVTQMGLAEPIDAKIVDRSKFQPQAQMSHVFSPSCYSTVIATGRTRFPRAGRNHGPISGTSRRSRARAACATTPSTISKRR